MRAALFYHSLVSDWNHGNAHFLRGIATELVSRGHHVTVYVPRQGWSVSNLLEQEGQGPITAFHDRYPGLSDCEYELDRLDLEQALEGVDLVIVHEWSEHDLVRRIGEHRARNPDYRLLFHDTHHRSLTDRRSMANYDLRHYDGVLAFGAVIRDLYLAKGWAQNAWVWHEAADVRIFHPTDEVPCEAEVVWVGNWGDEERTAELYEFLFDPVTADGLRTNVFGVRYPEAVQQRPYVEALPGIPTIRPFEALACGIPLVCAPWEDSEGLFTPGKDFLVARNGKEMRRHLHDLVHDPDMAAELALHGHRTILRKHTCAHRVDELFGICHELGMSNGFHHGSDSPHKESQ